MINRRTLLLGTAGTLLTSLLTSCRQTAANALKVTLLEGSIPSQVLQRFQKQADTPVNFEIGAQIDSIFQQLQRWQKEPETSAFSLRRFLPWVKAEAIPKPNHLVSLSDYWLESAIAQKLIAPLEIPSASLEKLPAAWQQFASRDAKGQLEGQIPEAQIPEAQIPEAQSGDSQPNQQPTAPKISLWAAPYQFQSLVIIYHQRFWPDNQPPFASWRDLLQPSLRQSLALPGHPRLVMALAEKIQRGRFNPILEGSTIFEDSNSSLALETKLVDTLQQLHRQVKTYDSKNSIKALINEDVKAVVGWSGDAIAASKRYRDLKIVVPAEGSLLSADMWVRPKGAQMSAAAQQWIDFCWQSGPATEISISNRGLSPIFLQKDISLPKTLAQGLLSAAAIENSEPLLPIPMALQTAYLKQWQQLRSGVSAR
jgi:putative spermidine/putrescine transport system substrate-binding protein